MHVVIRCTYRHCDHQHEDEENDNDAEDAEGGGNSQPEPLEYLMYYTDGWVDTTLPAWWFPIGGGSLQCYPNAHGLVMK